MFPLTTYTGMSRSLTRLLLKSKKATVEEQAWMDEITQFGCVICKKFFHVYSPPEIHHIAGKTRPDCHLMTLPLCYRHHRQGDDNELYTSRHPFKRRFVERYGTEQELLDYIRERIEWG
tara:strand:+ start:243 stop:599 length:357 start_codon:yes stop_codon:yes gene_type:complete